MLETELKELIEKIQKRKTEFQTVELKSSNNGFPKRIYDTISAFSNQDQGGVIIFGLSEDNNYEAVGVYDLEDAQKKISEACEQMEPIIRAVITRTEVDGKFVLSAEIPPVEYHLRPVFYKGAGRLKGAYIRVGDADEPMSEYEVYSYEAFRRRIDDELRTVKNANPKLIQQDRLNLYLNNVKHLRINLANNVSDDDLLELMGITSKGELTLAGVMSFSIYPQAYFPQLCITAVCVPGTEMGDTDDDGSRFIDNKRITGSIPDMLDGAVDFVRKNMRVKTIIDSLGKRSDKTEYPIIAVREAILNALIHRDYSVFTENTPICIEMYKDRLMIKSKGGLYGGGAVEQLGRGRPETRNPALANIMELLSVTENRYSGIPTIRKELKNSGLPEPIFKVSRGLFSVTFRNGETITPEITIKNSKEMAKAVLNFCYAPRSRAEIITLTGKSQTYTMNYIVKPLLEKGLLRMTNPEKPKSNKQKYVAVSN